MVSAKVYKAPALTMEVSLQPVVMAPQVFLLFALVVAVSSQTLLSQRLLPQQLLRLNEQQLNIPRPFSFEYNNDLEDGANHYHTSSGDGSGRVVGSYGLVDIDGRQRIVDYEADELGFRANVRSNEPGVANSQSADVQVTGAGIGLGSSIIDRDQIVAGGLINRRRPIIAGGLARPVIAGGLARPVIAGGLSRPLISRSQILADDSRRIFAGDINRPIIRQRLVQPIDTLGGLVDTFGDSIVRSDLRSDLRSIIPGQLGVRRIVTRDGIIPVRR